MKKLLIVKKEEDSYLFAKLAKRGSKYILLEAPQKTSLKKLKGKQVIAVKYFPELYLGRETLPTGPKELIELQLRERLKELGIFEGTPLIIFHIKEDLKTQLEVNFVAINKFPVEEIISDFQQYETEIKVLTATQLATCYLTLQETDSPVISVYIDKDYGFLAITGFKNIHYLRSIKPIPGSLLTSAQVEEALLAVMDYGDRVLGLNLKGIIAYGPKRELLPETSLPLIRPDFSFIEESFLDTALEYPEFFGLPFVPQELNLLPADYQQYQKHFSIIRKITFAMLVGSILNYGIWFYYYPKVEKIKKEHYTIKSELNKELEKFNKMISPKEIKLIEEEAKIYEKYRKTFKLNEFLAWLSTITPTGVVITETSGKGNNLLVKAECKGDFHYTQQQLTLFLANLKERIDINENQIKLLYDQNKREGNLIIKGIYQRF
ncbi:Fimbrial assembly family protein [Thermodesulfatator indicus DSM 15286]|uniref:Fimbrial assembly family protein n=1 Tax=Thermodesulfatator indicus (strain DSM 15286 / JCM 11887 / CIR29812) TaxID=667014 RepID=F8ACA4_THEID|nr:hypothetical protein [Thermodesulfatator indicus]AEH45739.1 Fimbrial assembly family protein [Thermodesulfatator indicus DSM 15286]